MSALCSKSPSQTQTLSGYLRFSWSDHHTPMTTKLYFGKVPVPSDDKSSRNFCPRNFQVPLPNLFHIRRAVQA